MSHFAYLKHGKQRPSQLQIPTENVLSLLGVEFLCRAGGVVPLEALQSQACRCNGRRLGLAPPWV